MKLNEKIMKLRKERGLSQEEFGNAINVSRQAISKWETEQTKPDIDKLKEIAKFFDVSFEYLLNDEIDNIEDIKKETDSKINIQKLILRILIVILVVYLLISLYKFIALYRYYKIADSFSEENYWMSMTWEKNGEPIMDVDTRKDGSKIITETRNPYNGENTLLNENGEVIPYDIEFIDQEKEICYKLVYDENIQKYRYSDRKDDVINEEEFQDILGKDENLIKDNTLSIIPSDFKSILLTSLNPMSKVSIIRNEIYINNFNRMKIRILLSKDCLVENYILQTEFDGTIGLTFSYDYVQDHFKNQIIPPLEEYSGQIEIED